MGSCVQSDWFVGGGGLWGYFWRQGLPVGAQKCLERFHRGCNDYLSLQFIQKWDSTNNEIVMMTIGKISLLVEPRGAVAWHCAG